MATETSGFFQLNTKDFVKGLVMTVVTSVLTVIYDSFSKGSLTFDWKQIALVGGTAGIGYLLKNLFTGSGTTTTQQ